jgi:hypothetical protein
MEFQMNKLATVVISLFIFSAGAHAGLLPTIERPIWKATLTELDGEDREVGIGLDKILYMNESGSNGDASSFRFTEEKRVNCVSAPCPTIKNTTTFVVTRKMVTRCGSTIYSATELVPMRVQTLNRPLRRLQVVDHNTRLCEDERTAGWEVKISTPGEESSTLRRLSGNSETVPFDSQFPRNYF